jgi:hypothetical protein
MYIKRRRLDDWATDTAGLTTQDDDAAELHAAVGAEGPGFLANWHAWTAGNGAQDLVAAADQIRAARVMLGTRRAELQAAGDPDGAAALAGPIAQADAAQETARAALDAASEYASTWELLATWYGRLAGAVGLGFPVVPIALGVSAAVAAIGALAYVVKSWQETRSRADFLTDLANRVQGGTLTAGQAESLAASFTPTTPGLFAGVGTLGLLAAAVVAIVFLKR